jgi:hypothetical protein
MARWGIGGTVLGLLLAAVAVQSRFTADTTASTLQATSELRWYRGNMHTHSYWSDGDDFLENIALWYRERDYDFLVFTDHNVLARSQRWVNPAKIKAGEQALAKLRAQWPDHVETRATDTGDTEVRLKTFDEVDRLVGVPDEFLLIQGEEISDKFGKLPLHLNVHNLREMLPPRGGESVAEVLQNNVDAVIAQRLRTGEPMLVHVNHPNFGWGITAEDLMGVRGENFFEVYNGHPGVANEGDATHASTERIWDIINAKRLTELDLPVMYGLGTDDGHNYHEIPSRASEPGRGWVMVLAADLTPASLIEALEAGRFYASSGVTLSRVTSSETGLVVEVEESLGVTYEIEFLGTTQDADLTGTPVVDADGKEVRATMRYSDEIGRVLKRVSGPLADYRFQGNELYVRARVTASRLHPNPGVPGEFERAWVQPVVGPAGR